MVNLAKIALHPLALAIGLLSFLGTILGQPPFNLPPAVTFPVVLVVAVLTYVSAQLPAFHKDLVIEVPTDAFKTVVTVLVSGAGLIALLAQTLATAPYPLPPMVVYILAAIVSVITFVANELQAVDAPVSAQVAPGVPARPTMATSSSTSSSAAVTPFAKPQVSSDSTSAGPANTGLASG